MAKTNENLARTARTTDAGGGSGKGPVATAIEAAAVDRSALMTVLANVAGKESVRDVLPEGGNYIVNAMVSGDVSGRPFEPINLAAVMSIGHDSERASSATPNLAGLAAYLLAKMNASTRAAVLRDLPGEFEGNGFDWPTAPAEVIDACDGMLKKCRASKTTKVRGSVSVKHVLS